MTEANAEFLSQMPEVARQALTALRGTPLAMTEKQQDELIELLSLAEGQDLFRETYGLLCLGKWLFEVGQPSACYQVMDVANTATFRLEHHNEALAEAAEGLKKEIDKQLGTAAAKKAPRYGESAPEGAVSIGSLTSAMRRKII